jgi:hypothetical protein
MTLHEVIARTTKGARRAFVGGELAARRAFRFAASSPLGAGFICRELAARRGFRLPRAAVCRELGFAAGAGLPRVRVGRGFAKWRGAGMARFESSRAGLGVEVEEGAERAVFFGGVEAERLFRIS